METVTTAPQTEQSALPPMPDDLMVDPMLEEPVDGKVDDDTETGEWLDEVYSDFDGAVQFDEPQWWDAEAGMWTTSIGGVPVWGEEGDWYDEAGIRYVFEEGYWWADSGEELHILLDVGWVSANYTGEAFDEEPDFVDGAWKTSVGGEPLTWDFFEHMWIDSHGDSAVYSSQWNIIRGEGEHWVFDVNARSWERILDTDSEHDPKQVEHLDKMKQLKSLHGIAKKLKGLISLNESLQEATDSATDDPISAPGEQISDIGSQGSETADSWGSFLSSSGRSFDSGVEAMGELEKLGAVFNAPPLSLLAGVGKSIAAVVKTRSAYKNRAAFRKSMEGANDAQIMQSSAYAYRKTNRSFFSRLADTVLKVSDTVAEILTWATGGLAAVAMGVTKTLRAVHALTYKLGLKIKGLWKWANNKRGQHRADNSQILVKRASTGEQTALELLADLKIKESTYEDLQDEGKRKAAQKELAKKMKST